jgi:hypothetical protein
VLGDWTGTYTIEACTVDAPVDCMDGMHGGMRMRTRYQAATVAWDGSCVSEQQTETCSNGTWLPWTGTYAFETCVVSDPLDCAGGAHGTSQMRTRYATANVPDGSTCQSEVQTSTCTNGVWGSWSGAYTHETCDVLPPFAGSCTFNYMGTPFSCVDWHGAAYTSANAMAGCAASNTYSANHCANLSNLLGVCAVPAGSGVSNEYSVYFYEGAIFATAADAQTQCTTVYMGTWIPD